MRISEMFSAGFHGINQVSRYVTQTRHRKEQKKHQPDLSLRYAGDWSFVDPQTKHQHDMAIGRDFTIKIDQHLLPGRIIGLDEDQLIFLDHYGFQLKVFANHAGPVEVYDESSNQTYPVINHRDAPVQPEQQLPDTPAIIYQVKQSDQENRTSDDELSNNQSDDNNNL